MPLIPSLTLLPQVEMLAILQHLIHIHVFTSHCSGSGTVENKMCKKPKLRHASGIPTLDNSPDEFMTVILINCHLSSPATLRVFCQIICSLLCIIYYILSHKRGQFECSCGLFCIAHG